MAMTGGESKLVSTGTPPGWPGPISLYVYYKEESQSIDANETVLSLGMYVTTPTGWYFGPWVDFYGSYVGTASSGDNCKKFNGACPANTQGTRWLVEDQRVTVTHNDDGTKTATIYWQWGVHSDWSGVMNNPSGSFTVELTTIPRATTLDTLSCATKYFTGQMTYKYTPKSYAYYNRCNITLIIGETHTDVKTINIGQKSAEQQTGTVTLSDSELSIIYNKLPSTTNGTLKFTLLTYSDSDYSKQVGSEGCKEVALSIPDDTTTKPSVSMSLDPVSSLGSAFDGLYIQGKTKVKADLDATGQYGATIKSCSMKVGGTTYDYDDSYTSGYLSTPGNHTVYAYANDSRGFTGSTSQDITVIAYANPKILDAVAERCDANGTLSDTGTYLKIIAERSYSPVKSGGVQKNFCQIRFRYKLESAPDYSEWTTILAGDSLSSNKIVTGALLGGVLSTESTYLVQIQAVDDIGESATTTVAIMTETVYMHRTKNAMGLGKYVEGENILDVAWDTHLRGEVKIGALGMTLKEYILAVISEGG